MVTIEKIMSDTGLTELQIKNTLWETNYRFMGGVLEKAKVPNLRGFSKELYEEALYNERQLPEFEGLRSWKEWKNELPTSAVSYRQIKWRVCKYLRGDVV
jgi:hypothetical protein